MYSRKKETLTHNDFYKYLQHYSIKNLKKVGKSEKIMHIKHHFLGRTNIEPASITRKD